MASALECEGVVYFCENCLDLVICAIGSLFLDYLIGLQLFCAFDGYGPSGYRFLIIH